jgi:PAS domain S-box-containing protein
MQMPARALEGLPPVDLATLDLLPDPAWVTTVAEGVAYFNTAWLAMTGSTARVLSTAEFVAFLHPDDAGQVISGWRAGREQRAPFALECRVLRADGSWHWFLLRAVSVQHDGVPAGWLGTIIDVDAERRARDALTASEARARSIANAIPQLIGIAAPDGSLVSVNDQQTAYTGKTIEQMRGQGWIASIHPDDVDGVVSNWRAAVAAGGSFDTQYRLLRYDGAYRWFLNKAIPVRDAAGTITAWIGTATDIDERKRAEDALRVVVEASTAFADTLDAGVALQRLAELAATHLADWCCVYVYDAHGVLRPSAIAHRDAAKVRFVRDYLRRYPMRDDDAAAMVAATGMPLRIDQITPEMYDAIDDPDQRALARSVGLRSLLYVPLGSAQERFGVLILAIAESMRRFTEADEHLATLIAQRAAIAVGNARLYERQREVARTLQSAFLPPALPRAEGVAFDAAYAPGSRDLTIGGDWYDAFPVDEDRVAFSVGDVAGRGLEAAVPMGKMRQTFRALGVVDSDPAWSIAVADSVLRREHPDIFVTAFVGLYDPSSRRLAYANAGHPAPFVRAETGALSRIEAPGVPLGLGAYDSPRTWEAALSAGDLLVVFTDGLIESTHDIDEGEGRLAEALAHPAFGFCREPAALLRALIVPDEPGDDIAILTLRVGAGADWSFDANDARAAQAARKSFVGRLRAAGVNEENRVACEIVFGEIVGNAARYTPGPVDVALLRDGSSARLAALDRGPGFRWNAAPPPDEMAESGRGLFLIGTLGREVRVEHIAGFGSYVEVVLPVGG